MTYKLEDLTNSSSLATPGSEEVLRKKLLLLRRRKELEEGVPHLYGWRWYGWAKEFFESTNKINLLCAANQISKSSTQIRKCIEWATNISLWTKLWQGHTPNQFWYLYPTSKQATAEFQTKWPQFLPKGKYKTSLEIDGRPNPYHWVSIMQSGEIQQIYFPITGVRIFFKTYTQNVQSLQTGTVDSIFCDEELPVNLYDELMFRISASGGYFHMVFTATLGQEYWRLCMEHKASLGEKENLPEAKKWTVSMYDCMYYLDGSASHWSRQKIDEIRKRCQSKAEVLKRIYGRFVMSQEGLKYPTFSVSSNTMPPRAIPSDWKIYAGVDIGSGMGSHPASIVFVAVRPDYQYGEIFLGWRGDKQLTTAKDVLDKFREMRGSMFLQAQYFDWASKDFETISHRDGEPFIRADKDRERGSLVINTLFKSGMLRIHETGELNKLVTELMTLREETSKQKAKDDLIDASRYVLTGIPWDWGLFSENLRSAPVEEVLTPAQQEISERRKAFDEQGKQAELEEEFSYWNEIYG